MSNFGLPFPTKLISEILLAGCQDSGDAITEAAFTAITKCVPELQNKNDVMDLSPIFPPFLGLLERCLENGEDELVISGFECLLSAFEIEQPLINEHIEAITKFILNLLIDLNQEIDESVKDAASDTLIYLIERRGKQFVKKKLVKPTLSMLMSRIAQEEGCVLHDSLSQYAKGEAGGDEEEERSVNDTLQSCRALIDKMAMAIPAKSFADIVFEMSEEAILSADTGMRKAGCLVLGTVIEGLRDSARERIDELLQLVVKGLDDSGLHVRETAAFAIGQFSEHAYPEVYLYHHSVIPAAIKGLSDEGLIVQVHCCYALEHFCEQLKPIAIKPYISDLVNHVGQLAQSKIPAVQEAAVRALAATAIAAEEEFQPYVDDMMAFLEPLLVLYDKEEIWSAAIGCIGHIAVAVGRELFKPAYYELGMKAVMEGVKSESHKIVESSLIHVANMAKLMKKDFEPMMKELMPYIFEVFNEKEFEIEDRNDEDAMDEDDDDDDEGADEVNVRWRGSEGIIAKKVAAVTAVGSLAEFTQSCFLPYLDLARNVFIYPDGGALFSVSPDIRAEAASVFHQFIEVPCDVANIPTPVPCEKLELPEDVKEITAVVLMHLFHLLDHDDQKKVVSEAIQAIGLVFKRLGVAVFDLLVREMDYSFEVPCSTLLTQRILTYLEERGHCQTVNRFKDDEGEEEEDEEEADEENHIHLLMENLGDLIGILAKVSGPGFVLYFDQFHPKLLKFTKPSRSQPDRDMAVCCYAEVFEGMGSSSLKYAESVIPILQSALQDLDSLEAARRNAAFCLGILVEVAGRAFVPRYLQFLQWLHPVCVRKEAEEEEEDVGGADVDNALSTVAKMILVASDAVPLNQVLPVMFAALPIKEDFTESITVFKAFLSLIDKKDPVILGMVNELVPLLIESFEQDSEIPEQARNYAAQALAILAANPSYRDIVHNSLSSISDQEHLKRLQTGLYAYGMFWTGKAEI